MAPVCTICFPRQFVSKRGRDSNIIWELHSIERYALNTTGNVGSFYNAWTDDILTCTSVDTKQLIRKQVQQKSFCQLIKVPDHNRHNILKLLKIDNELRISAALNMMKTTEEISGLYSYQPPANRTIRLISYYRIDQEEYLSNDNQCMEEILPDENVTHVITGVNRGIDFVMVLELSDNENNDEIDSVLEKLCECFKHPESDFLSKEDQQKINDLRPILFTSNRNIQSFATNEDYGRTCQEIHRYINENRGESAICYTLHPVGCIYSDPSMNNRHSHKFNFEIASKIEETMFRLLNQVRHLQHIFDEKIKSQSSLSSLQSLIESTFHQLNQLNYAYTELQQNLAAQVCSFRQGNFVQLPSLRAVLDNPNFIKFTANIEDVRTAIVQLLNTISFSKKLQTDFGMEYLNVADFEETMDDQKTLEDKLLNLGQQRFECYLIGINEHAESNANDFQELCKKLSQTTSPFKPAFADFSYCRIKPKSMKILRPKTASIVKDNETNILLVGESGVGKSTFINAFANYLAFPSLQQATVGKPMVLIPVSFMITMGDDFQEKWIEFGQSDANENYNTIGQSVTQYCKSYIFSTTKHTRLRIIDTPGFGDTRGVEQDDRNIDHIISYISQLSHLNAICFLSKPNTTRLHALFRACFMQLMSFLGPDAYDHVLFCFTNTRSAFYTPGDTSKLLKSMLAELPDDQRPPFEKKNIFCFDSEAFRYLAMIQQEPSLAFTGEEKIDFERSWQISVKESIRLFDSLNADQSFSTNQGFHSIKHAQIMITSLIQPILETIRNCLRNIILYKLNDKQYIIQIKPQVIALPAWVCVHCPNEIIRMGDISIAKYRIHRDHTRDGCECCRDTPTEYLSIFYEPNYQFGFVEDTRFLEETETMNDRLLLESAILSQFLLSTMEKSKDLFSSWFDLFINQEKYLYSKVPSSVANNQLHEELCKAKVKYLDHLQNIKKDIELNAVYECFEGIATIPCIKTQLAAIKASQMKMLRTNECDVSS